MADKVAIYADGKLCGRVTVFDSPPSIDLLAAAFPEAIAIVEHIGSQEFEVHLGEANAIAWAD